VLTYYYDRWMAFTGLARRVQERPGLHLTAGLWCERLLTDLLWYASSPGLRIIEGALPSWSWVSLRAEIQSLFNLELGGRAEFHSTVRILARPETD